MACVKARSVVQAAAVVVVAAILAACSGQETPAPVMFATLPPLGTQVLVTVSPGGTEATSTLNSLGPIPDPTLPASSEGSVTSAAMTALARELGVSEADIAFVSIAPDSWNDASLGCPQPGQTYVEVVTSGYVVSLSAGGTAYEVHTDTSGNAVVCNLPDEPVANGPEPDPIVAEFIATAIDELKHDLAIGEDQIAVVRSEAVDWNDASLGCAEPGQNYNPVVTPGYRIVLAVEEQRYEFHTDYQRMIRCDNPTQ